MVVSDHPRRGSFVTKKAEETREEEELLVLTPCVDHATLTYHTSYNLCVQHKHNIVR